MDLKSKRRKLRGKIEEMGDDLEELQAAVDNLAERIQRLTDTETWPEDPNSGAWLKSRGEEMEKLQNERSNVRTGLESLKKEYRDLTGRQI